MSRGGRGKGRGHHAVHHVGLVAKRGRNGGRRTCQLEAFLAEMTLMVTYDSRLGIWMNAGKMIKKLCFTVLDFSRVFSYFSSSMSGYRLFIFTTLTSDQKFSTGIQQQQQIFGGLLWCYTRAPLTSPLSPIEK